jgi:pyruvate-ferredoxin/flavodoxin oxidoreductase
MRFGQTARDSGTRVLYRFNPSLKAEGKNPLSLYCKVPSVDIEEYMYRKINFRSLRDAHPNRPIRRFAS